MAKAFRYQVERDGLTCRPRFSRRFAVVDTARRGADDKFVPVLQTDDVLRANSFADELNAECA